MSNKFEQLLDYLVNEEHEKANELFHEIVVEKSRDIYESLIAEEEKEDDDTTEEGMDTEEEATEEGMDSEEETTESIFGEADEEDDSFPAQDQGDDLEADTVDQDFGGDDEDAGDTSAPADKGDIQDLEDALEELKAEFEALMSAERNEEENEPGIHGEPSPLDGMDGEEGEEETEEESTMPMEEEDKDDEEGVKESRVARTQGEKMREYIEKVSATMDGGLVGARTGETVSAPVEGKSPISSGSGKPTSGANAKNIAQAGKGVGEMSGTSPNADKGSRGLVGATKGEFTKAGTHNVNNVKSGIKTVKPVAKVSNKEGAGVGAVASGDKAGQTGGVITKSPLSGAPK